MNKPRYETDPVYRAAVDAGANGDHERAIELYRLLLHRGPETASLRWMLGYEYFEKGRYDEALAELQRAILLDKKCHPAWQGIGRIYRKLDEFSNAEHAFRQSLDLERSVENHVYLAEVLYRLRRYPEAITLCEDAIRGDPSFEEAYLNLGILLEAEGNHDSAILALTKAIQLDPQYASAYSALGDVYSAMGRDDLAHKSYAVAEQIANSTRS